MRISTHIKAFTILEIVISLAIMSIIIAIVYSIYIMMSEQLYKYSRDTEAVNAYNQTHLLIKGDVFAANKINQETKEIHLVTDQDTITYSQDNNQLIRKTAIALDTLDAIVTDIRLREENETVDKSYKSIVVNYDLLGIPIEGVYYKDYGIASSINNIFFSNGN